MQEWWQEQRAEERKQRAESREQIVLLTAILVLHAGAVTGAESREQRAESREQRGTSLSVMISRNTSEERHKGPTLGTICSSNNLTYFMSMFQVYCKYVTICCLNNLTLYVNLRYVTLCCVTLCHRWATLGTICSSKQSHLSYKMLQECHVLVWGTKWCSNNITYHTSVHKECYKYVTRVLQGCCNVLLK
jgi:hypothetical protein